MSDSDHPPAHADEYRGRRAYPHLTEMGPSRRHLVNEHPELGSHPHGQDSDWFVTETHARAHGVLLAPLPEVETEVETEDAPTPASVVRESAHTFAAAIIRGDVNEGLTPRELLDGAADHITALLDLTGRPTAVEPDADDLAERVRIAARNYADSLNELDSAIDVLARHR